MFSTKDKAILSAMFSLGTAVTVFILLAFNQVIPVVSSEDDVARADFVDVAAAAVDDDIVTTVVATATATPVEVPTVEDITIEAPPYVIMNPYESVDWDNFGQFRASLHNHTHNSDGSATTADMIEKLYAMDYDIVAITDHNYLTARWSEVSTGAMMAEREAEILAGTGRYGRPLIPVPFSSEQSRGEHLNTYFAKFNSPRGAQLEDSIRLGEETGGISVIVHPGRYASADMSDYQSREAAASNPDFVQRYSDIFMQFPSCIGMEIVNRGTDVYFHDRILWDNILAQTMPYNRPVWGFANDDAHSLEEIGFAFNVLLIDREDFLTFGLNGLDATTEEELREQSASNPVRDAMVSGAFYAVSRIDRAENINSSAVQNRDDLLALLSQTTPSISNIVVDEQEATITISGADYDEIEWVADGIVISTGNVLDVPANTAHINSYVRAQLRSSAGIAFTQPFGIVRTDY